MKILNGTNQLKMEYLKLLMAPQLTDLIVPYNTIEQEADNCLLLTLIDCPVKTYLEIFCYNI